MYVYAKTHLPHDVKCENKCRELFVIRTVK